MYEEKNVEEEAIKPAVKEKIIEKEKVVKEIPNDYRPISAWGYLGYKILFAIPLIGFIVALIFACGGTRNVNLKNYARSYFLVLILTIVICALIVGAAARTIMQYL